MAINADHIRLLDVEDYRARLVPYLHDGGVVSAASYGELNDGERSLLDAAAPLAQTRMQLTGEA